MWTEEKLNQMLTTPSADYVEVSRRLCERVRGMGMRIVWDPSMTEKVDRSKARGSKD